MGKIVVIFLFLVAAFTSSILSGTFERSEEIPEMLNGNFQDIGSYALQYAINQVFRGQVTTDVTIEYTDENHFEVMDGNINKIQYNLTTTTTTADYLEDDPNNDDEDDNGVFVYDITGTLNINPANSERNQFEMETPDLYVDRSYVHTNAPEYEYTGPASLIKVKPKAQGRTVQVNSIDFELNTNTRYVIRSDSMTVHVWNDHIKKGKAMGHWWITINAPNAVLELDPGIPIENFASNFGWSAQETFTHIELEVLADVSMDVNKKTLRHNSHAGAVIIVSENEDVYWWTANVEDSNYKITYWNP